jgi:hypothetical protein
MNMSLSGRDSRTRLQRFAKTTLLKRSYAYMIDSYKEARQPPRTRTEDVSSFAQCVSLRSIRMAMNTGGKT